MIKAVIFDMDGVIADTEPLHEQARNILLADLGLDVESISPAAIGRSKRVFWGEVAEKYKLSLSADELTRREFVILMKIVDTARLRPIKGLPALLEFLRRAGIKAAIASSSDRNYVECVLRTTGLEKYFCAMSCGDEVRAAKPAPDVYLRALALCGVSAGEALAVEDSDTGAKAAAAAGIACVAYDVVETDNWKQTFDVCRYKVTRMEDIERIVLNGNGRYAAI